MAAAPGLPAEQQQQQDSAPVVDAVDEALISTEEQRTASKPETGELLNRVAAEVSQAFQTSLVQVLSDIGREYGVASSPVKFARMEKGDAAVAPGDEQLLGKPGRDDVHRLSHELQLSRLQVRQLQQVVDELHDEQRVSQQKLAFYSALSTKLKRDLIDERLALVDANNEIKELRRRRSRDDASSGGGGCARSPRSPHVAQEPSENPWTASNESIVGPASGASGSSATAGATGGSSLMAFDFYPSESSRGAGDHEGIADDDEPPSPSSTTQTLRNTLMDQFLPSALLDSPQVTPRHAKAFADDTLDEEKALPFFSQGADDLKSPSLPVPPPLPGASLTSATAKHQGLKDGEGDGLPETSHDSSGRVSVPSAVASVKLSMLSEVFDAIPIKELEMILRRFDDQELAAMDYILSTHPSVNPVSGARRTAESGSNLASMTSTPPSRSSNVGHSKTSAHRSGSQVGLIEPPPGSANNWKTEICMYYMQGKCNKTRRTCSFAHGESDLVRPGGSSSSAASSKHVPGYKTRICQAYENGTCPKPRRDCLMAHGVNDLRDGGSGSGGSGGSQTILPSATPRLQSYKTELCYYFLKGNCNYSKEECRFAHGQNDLRTVEGNTAQMAAAASGSGFGVDFGPSSPVPPPPPVSMEKQLQLQYQYQQQYQQQHHQPPPAAPFQLQPPPAQQPGFVPQHQIQLQQSSRGGAGQHPFGFQHQPYDPAQHHQQYMPHPGQYRYLKTVEDKRSTLGGRLPRRDSGSSWSSFDATGLPPSEY